MTPRSAALLAGALLALGLPAAAAQGQALADTDAIARVPREAGNVVGGGSFRMLGGGDDLVIRTDAAGPWQEGRNGRLVNHEGEQEVAYLGNLPRSEGRHAVLPGGGDESRIVCVATTVRRRRG
ncbi:hypothetical protein GCM10010964_21480 [Caldovatus sediminis]|uniref:Uncharacterized protein n=1 Tax=Caldovatus sediminis TaxID=2041189 RepID=A0A8J2ZBS8_9PROT|nr:hypothetical protein [Caldovatus sediminis]GGG33301.1 hypothetical protein GCM10010964_21480 [Caldovatus sediminis]